MLSEFLVYLRLGFEHIADPRGYDHILFIVALTAVYAPREWLRVLVLVTAFTAGHTLTLVLATLGLVRAPTALVEFLIPVTIVATAALNAGALWATRANPSDMPAGRGSDEPLEPRRARATKYVVALAFGLVHGLGFSSFLRAVLGGESSITVPLLAFNVGLEVGQVIIVVGVVATTAVATRGLRVPRRGWTLALSGAVGAVALLLAVERLPV